MVLIYLASAILLKNFITYQYRNIIFDIKIQLRNFSWKIRSSGNSELGLLPGNNGEDSLQKNQKSLPSWSLLPGGGGERGEVQFSSVLSNSLWPHGLQHARLPCPSPAPRACSDSCPSSQWCHPTISSSVIPFSSCLQSFQTFQWVSSMHQVAKTALKPKIDAFK